jgi:hypothetical protein
VEGRKKEVSEVCGVCVSGKRFGERKKGKNAQREREWYLLLYGGMKRRDNVESFFIRKLFLLLN